MRIGEIEVLPLIDGEILGPPEYMYPDVPEAELARANPFLDPQSRAFVYTIGAYALVMPGDRLVLVDAGIGPLPTPPSSGGGLRSALLAWGFEPADVTDVVFTHLHFDHIGWATQNGEPFFPNATFHADRRDWDHYMAPDYRHAEFELRATNVTTDAAGVRLAPIADRIQLWEGTAPVLPGLSAVDAAGHSPGTVLLMIESADERGALLGDIAHAIPELLHGWSFRSHGDPETAVRSMIRVRDFLAAEAVPCSGSHFPGLQWGYVRHTEEGYQWEEII